MASDYSMKKQPYAVIEIPLQKFTEQALPFHKKMYEIHKISIIKGINNRDINQLKHDVRDKKNAIRQLKDLLYELDTLRAQVEDGALDKFDTKTFSLRREIGSLIKDYIALERTATQIISETIVEEQPDDFCDPFVGLNQIQLQESIEELKLKSEQKRLNELENINENIEDLHGMYHVLNTMVLEQKESVDIVEENVEEAHVQVNEGTKTLSKICKFKATAYPITGALLGTIIGGPVGLVAGLKVGGLAALGFGVAGYTGGRLFKKFNDTDLANNENENTENVQTEVSNASDKKDI